MSLCKAAKSRIAFAFLLGLVGLAPAASAVTSTFKILLNLDNNVSTGCDVPTLTGTFKGVERILITTVNTGGTSASVTAVQFQSCVTAPSTFSAPAPVPAPPGHPLPWPVGFNNGTGGTSVIETYIPTSLAPLGPSKIVRLGVLAYDSGGVLRDELLQTKEGPGNGPPILFQADPIGQIPTLSEWGLILLGLLLAGSGVALLRRRTAMAFLMALVLLGGAGIAWAAVCDLDGTTIGEWGPGTQLATEPTPDAPAGTDMRALFGINDGMLNALCFRIDALLLYNQPPVANNDTATVTEDSGANTIPVLANDSDPESDPFTIGSVTQPANGTVAITNGGADLTYTPNANYCNNPPGTTLDTFTYSLAPGGSTATVTVTVTCVDDNPTAVNDSATVAEDSGATAINVLANDTDPDGGTKLVTAVQNPSANGGTVLITGGGTGVTYQPAANYCNNPPGGAPDTFTYTITGGSMATVSVTVNCQDDPPVAVNDLATVNEDSGANTINVLANDTDTDGGPKSIASVTQPANGTVAITNSGADLTYTPNANYCNNPPGTTLDTFTYTLTPGSSTATVTVTVTCVNDAPVVDLNGGAAGTDFATTFTEGNAATPIESSASATITDADSANLASLTVTITNLLDPGFETLAANTAGTSITALYTPATGVLALTGSDTVANYQQVLRTITYQNTDADPNATTRVIQFVANDGTSNSNTATAMVTIVVVDNPPTAVNDSATVTEDSGANTINVLANDTDPDGGPKSIASVTQPANGAVVITNGGADLTYAPNANYCNNPPGSTPDTFTYTLTPGGSSATVSVTVNCVNDAPVIDLDANDDKGTGGSDFAVTFTEGNAATLIEDSADATITDSDSTNLASLTVTITNLLDSGFETLAANTTGTSITANYVPATGVLTLTGPDTVANFQTVLRTITYVDTSDNPNATARVIQFVANDGTSNSNTATATVTIVPVDDNPTAVNDSATVAEDSGANAIDVLANDTDPDGGTKLVSSVQNPSANGGTVLITGGGTGVTYQPAANYCNSVSGPADTFTYTLTPGGSTATVSVTVTCADDPPTAVADVATVNEDSGANTINVQANDVDIDGGTNTISAVTQPANGTVVITNGGLDLTYAPNANYCNTPPGTTLDTFNYTLSPGGSTAPVTVTVTCINDAPVIDLDANDDKGTTGSDFAVTFTEGDAPKLLEDPVDASLTDVDSANLTSLTVTITNLLDSGFETLAANTSGTSIIANYTPGTGVLALTGTDTVANYQQVLRTITYQNTDTAPDATPRVIHFVANDGTANSNTATSTVTVVPVDSNPVAVNDSATVNEDSGATAINVLANDTDADGGPKSIASVTQPANGTVVITGGGTGLTYAPNANYCNSVSGTPDTFTYTLTPGGSTATVSVTVTCVDDNPVAVNDSATVVEDSGANTINVLANDTDPDAGPKSITSVTQPANGTVVITNGGADLTYAPNANYCNSVSGTPDTFTYTLTPGGSTATVSVTVTCVDDNPVAVNDSATVVEDSGANAINVLANDTDVDGGPKSITSVTQPANGAVVITGGGTGLTYAPNANYCNSVSGPADTFTYTLTPGGSTATVSVTVTCVNDPPTDIALSKSDVDENQPINTVVGTFSTTDPDVGDTHTYTLVAGAGSTDNGSFNISGNQLRTSAVFNFEVKNSYSIRVRTTDSGALFFEKVFTITVNDLPEAPVAGNDSYDTIGNTELRVDLAAGTTPNVAVTSAGSPPNRGVLHNDTDDDTGQTNTLVVSGIVGCADTSAPFGDSPTCATANGGAVIMQSDGSFSFHPKAGDTAASDSFQYTARDTTSLTSTGTVTINRFARVWYVKNDDPLVAPASDDGTSVDPFDTLVAAQTASSANDYIFVYFGNGTTTGQAAGIALKNGQHLIGQFAGLTVTFNPAITFNGVAGTTSVPLVAQPLPTACSGNPCRPMLDDTVAGAPEGVAATDAIPTEIVGLNLAGNVNGVDWTTTAAFAGTGTLTIRDNVIRSAAAEGVDINLAGTGATNLSFHDNNITSTGTGLDIQETGTGALTITAFDDNVVSGNTGGSGININTAIFDSVPGGAINTVDGGTTIIGASGNGVGGAGMILTNVQGDLHFTGNLNIFADGGTGLGVSGTGVGMQLRVNSGGSPTGIVEAINGPAVDATAAALDLRLTSAKSTNSASTGVSLTNVTGTFSAESGSSITNSTGMDFNISGGTANVTYNGTITDDVGQLVSIASTTGGTKAFTGAITDGDDGDGSGISLTSNTGATIRFSGGLVLSTGANPAFTATGGGTVEVCDENPCNPGSTGANINKITTTTGTALNVANTTIGSNNLEFRSISAGTAASGPANGIVLNTTGSSGGLKVKGNGSAGTGGTIQKTTGDGISMTSTSSVSLSFMNVQNSADDGIDGTSVAGFSLSNASVTGNGTAANQEGISFSNVSGAVSITNTTATGNAYNNLRIDNTTGTISSLTISGSSFSNNSATVGNHGALIEIRGTSQVTTASITGTTFSGNKVIGIQVTSNDTATVSDFTISGCTITNNELGIDFSKSQTSSMQFKILNNTTFTGQNSHGINLFTAVGAGTTGNFQGRIQGNTIGNAGVAGSGSAIGNCIRVNINGDANADILLDGNTLRQCPNGRGIEVIGRNGTGGLDVTVTNNNVDTNAPSNPLSDIVVQSNCATVCNTVRADVRGNTVKSGNTSTDFLTAYLILVESGASTLQLVDTAPASPSCAQQLGSANTGSTDASAGCALIAGPINTPP
jgi:VCBS repeat-containing protein